MVGSEKQERDTVYRLVEEGHIPDLDEYSMDQQGGDLILYREDTSEEFILVENPDAVLEPRR